MEIKLIYVKWLTFFILLIFSLSACSNKLAAPLDKDMGRDPFGATIKVKYRLPDKKRYFVQGEILATQNDTLFVLVNRGKAVNFYTIEKIASFDIISYSVLYAKMESNNGYMASSALILTHGFFLPSTLLLNGITMAIITANQNGYYTFTSRELEFKKLYYFARFPQGIPPGINPASLQMR
ncbi:MAG: hypothetical protein IPN10_18175 [Saprospiraceae bacterium]|nr:hypothetical protein [Saprospiraceae bacterium]